MDLSSVPAWFEKVAQWLIGSLIAALLGGFLGSWFHDWRRVRREHLDAIKAEVFRPVQEDLEHFYLPLLQGTLGPVVSKRVDMPAHGSLSRASRTWRWVLSLRQDIGEEPYPFLEGRQKRPQPNRELYEDARRRHFKGFLHRLEAFKGEVERYTASWMPYAEHLSRTILERSGLPILTPELDSRDAPFVDAHGLSAFLLDRQLGATSNSPEIRTDPPTLRMAGRPMARATSPQEIERLKDILEDLHGDRRTPDELRREAESLLRQATELLGEVKQLLLSSKLQGRCRLAKV